MSSWSTYEARLGKVTSQNNGKRDSALMHIRERMQRKITSSLSYKDVVIDGEQRQFAVVDTTDFDTKKIFALPGEDIPHGKLVEWADTVWLITEYNFHNEFCAEGKMRQCNYYLKWIDVDGNVISRWCIVEDGTKYLIGEKSADMMTIGDARIAITIGKDADTNKLHRGMRFLVDDMDSCNVVAYQITKPNKLFNVYNGKGVFRFILNEVNVTDDDNIDLRIADYYSWKPQIERAKPDVQVEDVFVDIVEHAKEAKENLPNDIAERKVWL